MTRDEAMKLLETIHKQRDAYNKQATDYSKATKELVDTDVLCKMHEALLQSRHDYFLSLERLSDSITPFINELLSDNRRLKAQLSELYHDGQMLIYKQHAQLLGALVDIACFITKQGTQRHIALNNPNAIEAPGHRKKALIDIQSVIRNVFKDIGYNY